MDHGLILITHDTVSRVRELRSDIQHEPHHDVNLLIPDFHLQTAARFDKALLQDIV